MMMIRRWWPFAVGHDHDEYMKIVKNFKLTIQNLSLSSPVLSSPSQHWRNCTYTQRSMDSGHIRCWTRHGLIRGYQCSGMVSSKVNSGMLSKHCLHQGTHSNFVRRLTTTWPGFDDSLLKEESKVNWFLEEVDASADQWRPRTFDICCSHFHSCSLYLTCKLNIARVMNATMSLLIVKSLWLSMVCNVWNVHKSHVKPSLIRYLHLSWHMFLNSFDSMFYGFNVYLGFDVLTAGHPRGRM